MPWIAVRDAGLQSAWETPRMADRRAALSDGAPADRTNDRLDSWKEIAAYLKRDVSTVQRWEKTEVLPIRRHQHGKLGSVYAFRSEIDAWMRRRSRQGRHDRHQAKPDEKRRKTRTAVTQRIKALAVLAELEKAAALAHDTETLAFLGCALGLQGSRTKAQAILRQLDELSRQRYVSPFTFAVIHIGLGNHDLAFAFLDRACEERSWPLVFMKTWPMLDPIRSDARFIACCTRCDSSTVSERRGRRPLRLPIRVPSAS
jgi:predicted DNA-binding transcriptional regulator AlpA